MTTLTTTLSPVLRTEHRVTHALVEYADLLICPLDEVEQRVRRELDRNPALEAVDDQPHPPGGRTPVADPDQFAGAGAATDRYPSPDAVLADAAGQLDRPDRALAAWILADLDPRGFLEGGAEGVARRLGVDPGRVARVIGVLRTAGPPGLCAAGTRECLLLQLDAYERTGEAPPLTRTLIRDHLAELGGARVRRLAAAVGGQVPEVLAAREFIRTRLRPWAALDRPAPVVATATADLVVRFAGDGGVEVEVVGDPATRLRVDPLWAGLAEEPVLPAAQRRTLCEQARQARTFLAALQERADTLRRVAAYAAGRQRRYLCEGPAGHRPLTRAEVAGALDLHESTVSRAVSGKRLRLPDGRVVPFGALFGASGSVLATLRAVVAAEQRPLSDADLAAELRRRGYPVARRTVAKYRGQLGIPAGDRRAAG